MGITDELRRYAQVHDLIERKSLLVIADRIDTALEEGYVELPKDAKGQTIHVDEKLRYGANIIRTVEAVNERAFVAWNPEDRCYALYPAENFIHVKPDSWERIIEDAAKNIYPNGAFNPCWDKVRDELVERCKRLAGEDE